MQNIYETFEYQKIQEELIDLSKTELGKIHVKEMKMFPNEGDLKESLLDLDEMNSIYLRFKECPILTSANALNLIDIAKKTALLTARDLSLIAEDIITSNKVKAFFKKIDVSYPRIQSKVNKFSDLDNLEKEIHKVVTNSLTIDDKASVTLKEIRSKLKTLEANLIKKVASMSLSYQTYLNDDNVTLRDGHYVLPVKTAYKNKVLGIIYDVSDTGNTTFIEPLEIAQLNNEIAQLKVSENEEIRKILKALTALVLLQESEIINNNKIIAEIDFLQTKVKWGLEHNAIIPTLSDTQVLYLENARHPLIDSKKVIANTYSLDEKSRIVVISGPNAGGKTVSLKTVGLSLLLAQSGNMVPADKVVLSYFNHIYIDIGDNQSLSDNLSTFSAHMSHISEILKVVKGKDLCLFDELGTGTDPKEGEALALSVIKYLENKHCFAMVSSHFDKLKEYAFTSPNIKNSSMIFDEKLLKPTYIYSDGTLGRSYGIEVAKRYDLPLEVIESANDFLSKQDTSHSDELIKSLESKIIENDRLRHEIDIKVDKLLKEEKALKNDQQMLQNKKEALLESVKVEKQEIIEKTREQIDEILKEMRTGDLKVHEVIELKKKLDDLQDQEEEISYNQNIEVGDYVSYPSLNIDGRVKRINGNKANVLTNDGMSFDVEVNKLMKSIAPKNTKITSNKINYEDKINTNVGLELNIIGLRHDEAKDTLIKYLDNCRIKHLTKVKIIHGFGSGILRKMTHEYLNTQKDLTYRLGDAYEGGSGATVITFKND